MLVSSLLLVFLGFLLGLLLGFLWGFLPLLLLGLAGRLTGDRSSSIVDFLKLWEGHFPG